jgi:hypothetical protein
MATPVRPTKATPELPNHTSTKKLQESGKKHSTPDRPKSGLEKAEQPTEKKHESKTETPTKVDKSGESGSEKKHSSRTKPSNKTGLSKQEEIEMRDKLQKSLLDGGDGHFGWEISYSEIFFGDKLGILTHLTLFI